MSCFHLVFIISVDWSFILPITVNQKREKKKKIVILAQVRPESLKKYFLCSEIGAKFTVENCCVFVLFVSISPR